MLQELVRAGWDPRVFETLRTKRRQAWLFAIGRTTQLRRRPVTATLHSLHQVGKAVDIISRSRLWGSPSFFRALAAAATAQGLHARPGDSCHVTWEG
ncbi:hypothetical protein IMZ48_26520 [Candidatus Bathyarchaeota archaeon]|nr:hypothetical protein [Candidatus Bathyarchaeota archaeon]